MLHKLRSNSQGFTLIELMIVIAIIGILAAIAIPNVITYRNKSFCSKAEADANNVAAEISDFYSIPTNTACVTVGDIDGDDNTSNGVTVNCPTGDPSDGIDIQVTDASGRCPNDYQTAMDVANNPTGYWDGSNVYIKSMN